MSVKAKSMPMKSLRRYSLLDEHQDAAVTRLVERDETLLVAGMGAGKTIIALTAIEELLGLSELSRVLVVAPLRVATHVWAHEHELWQHTCELRVGVAVGTPVHRAAVLQDMKLNVVVINYECLASAADGFDLPTLFDGVVFDELDKCKSTGTRMFRAFRKYIRRFPWRVGMTGTPVSENLDALFGELLIVNNGATFGRNRTKFLELYFSPNWDRTQWTIRGPREEIEIANLAAPYIHTVPDYRHTLPALHHASISIEIGTVGRDAYRTLAKHSVLEDVTAVNEAVLIGKLQQVASGFVYRDAEDVECGAERTRWIHDAKREAFRAWLASMSEPALIVYLWDAQREWLVDADVPLISDAHIELWQSGRLPFMGLHPKAAAHGLNLQAGGARMLWLSPQWSRTAHDQTIARIWRRGQTSEVRVDTLIAASTADELVLERLAGKAGFHERFMTHLAELE